MRYTLSGLDCAGCAAKIEQELHKIKGLEDAIINFASQTLDLPPELFPVARDVIARIEPDVQLQKPADINHPGNKEKTNEEKHFYLIGVSSILLITGFFLRSVDITLHPVLSGGRAEYLVFLTAYLLSGGKIVWTALKNLVRGRVFDEHFLMSVSTIGAIAIHQLPEAVGVMLFYSIGEYFQDRAVNRSRRSIAALMDIRPDYANLKINGETRQVSPFEVEAGQVIVVRPGEKVPLDGVVIEGVSFVDNSALTGEPVPRRVEGGKKILAGMINGQGLLTVKVTRPFSESSAAKILDLIEKAGARKAPTEQFITTFSRYYTPVVVLGALALAVIPPLVLPGATFAGWIYRALVLLVISCPCALAISVPLGYFGGIGGASRHGILIKGANYLEALAKLHTVVFDKTGTLTKGAFRVFRVVPRNGFKEEEVLAAAAAAEAFSTHPIAHSIRQAYGQGINPDFEDGFQAGFSSSGGATSKFTSEQVSDYREIPGYGISARVLGKAVLVGNDRLMRREGIDHDTCNVEGAVVHVVIDGTPAGHIVIADEIKPDAAEAVARLKQLGVKKTVMLTGDEEGAACRVAGILGMDSYFSELLPEDKVEKVEALQAAIPSHPKQRLAFVGDGINDAPVIARADVGVAMGGLGSDAAIEAADVVLMEDAPSRLATAVEIARRTARIVRQNVILALGVKAFFLGLGTIGVATIWEAVFADVGVALIAVFNATRTISYREGHQKGSKVFLNNIV